MARSPAGAHEVGGHHRLPVPRRERVERAPPHGEKERQEHDPHRELAVDQPCVDACVDFRVITADPDPAWLKVLWACRLSSPADSREPRLEAPPLRLAGQSAASAFPLGFRVATGCRCARITGQDKPKPVFVSLHPQIRRERQ